MSWKVPEKFRDRAIGTRFESYPGESHGHFKIPSPDKSRVTRTLLYVLASPGLNEIPWEHVSARAVKQLGSKQFKNYTPTWDEMCFLKSLFWGDEDCVVQYHPPKSDYVNVHENVLHLYRPTAVEIPMPPKVTV